MSLPEKERPEAYVLLSSSFVNTIRKSHSLYNSLVMSDDGVEGCASISVTLHELRQGICDINC
jgi:hypothetical protein